MNGNSIVRLAKAIGYPQEVPAEAETFDFIVDGEIVTAEQSDGRIRLSTVLTEAEDIVRRFAVYAAGRILREDAVFAWDPERRAAILWDELAAGTGESDARRMVSRFETFCASADWWRERVAEEGVPSTAAGNAIVIHP